MWRHPPKSSFKVILNEKTPSFSLCNSSCPFGKLEYLGIICQEKKSTAGYHPQEDLSEFGCRPDVKVENLKNAFIFWLPAGTCCRDLEFFIKM